MSAVDEKMSTSEQVCDQLEQLIAAGGFEDGERLDENRLAQKFNTSRTPVREAFRLLSARGHVEIELFIRDPDIFLEITQNKIISIPNGLYHNQPTDQIG